MIDKIPEIEPNFRDVILPKVACLHVSFTAYENFYKLSKNVFVFFEWFPFSLHQKCQKQETQQSNIYPIVHWFTHP